MIDRIGPTRRPDRKPQGFQKWRSLLFMHWTVPVAELRPLLPEMLELDLFEGQAYVGVVPFAMEAVRPWWCPESLGFSFLETNVRTYVVYDNQPGVYFLSLEAASRIAVWAARRFWSLPYYFANMSMRQDGDVTRYVTKRSRTGVTHQVSYRVGESLGPSQPDSLEFFFLERYLLFAERRRELLVGQVHHSPYPAKSAEILQVNDDLMEAAGLPATDQLPVLAHFSEGVDVEVFELQPVNR